MVSDPVADMLTRIRNANLARHEKVVLPSSKLKVEIARLLAEEGYVEGYEVSQDGGIGMPGGQPRCSAARVRLRSMPPKTMPWNGATAHQ